MRLLAILLTVLFIGLKLNHTIGWSWGWVLAPLWMFIALWIGTFIVLAIGVIVNVFIEF